MAGVPYIAASMLEALTGKLEGGRPVVSVTVGARAPESDVADLLRETEAAHPGVAIGSYPFFKEGRYGAEFRDPVFRRGSGPGDGRGSFATTARGRIRTRRRRHLGRIVDASRGATQRSRSAGMM